MDRLRNKQGLLGGVLLFMAAFIATTILYSHAKMSGLHLSVAAAERCVSESSRAPQNEVYFVGCGGFF